MSTAFRFTIEPDWRLAPLAFWVHVPVAFSTEDFEPPAPRQLAQKGYAVLRVEFEKYELQFSAPEQLDHFIEVLSSKPLPTSRLLSLHRHASVGPNSHWLSRLPADLKILKKRMKLVEVLQRIRRMAVRTGPPRSFILPHSLLFTPPRDF